MKERRALAERIRRDESIPAPLAAALTAASLVYRLGMRYRLTRPSTRVDAHVVSFGNLTAGGTGKTPAVIERAREELAKGRCTVVLTRGYRAQSSGDACSSEIAPRDWYRRLGDEPALMLQKVPGLLVLKGRNRVALALRAVETFGAEVIILDDGFQYTPLHRDENVLVIDATNPFGNGNIIPRGILREPVAAMSRATAIVLTRCDQSASLDSVMAVVRRLRPDVPIRLACHAPVALRRLSDGALFPPGKLNGQPVVAACGIGNPEAFVRTLESLGALVTRSHFVSDHANWDEFALRGSPMIVTTEKDAIRIEMPSPNVYALDIALQGFPVTPAR